jgi:hypothetical protein
VILNGAVEPQALSQPWDRKWPECPPFAHWLPDHYPDRWVRFPSLPEPKRYPDSEAEYAIVLDRHYTVLSDLNPGSHLLIITAEWTDTPQTTPQRWPRRSEVAPTSRHWQTLIEEPDFRSHTQLYAKARPWQPGTLDILLRAVADDEINGVLLGRRIPAGCITPTTAAPTSSCPREPNATSSKHGTTPGCPTTRPASENAAPTG